MKRILVLCAMAVSVISCSKNKFKSQPQVEIKSFGPSTVFPGQVFTLSAKVRDKEGDLQDTVLMIRKIYNITTNSIVSTDTLPPFTLGDYGAPPNPEIELDAVFDYGQTIDNTIYEPIEQVDREITIGIIVQDNAGHKSDYIESNRILLKKY